MAGDHARKRQLIQPGFRLPSALDNRPLRFEEFENACRKSFIRGSRALGVSYANDLPSNHSSTTGLLDPPVEVRQLKDSRWPY